jgi:hypothetical protein
LSEDSCQIRRELSCCPKKVWREKLIYSNFCNFDRPMLKITPRNATLARSQEPVSQVPVVEISQARITGPKN